MAGPYGFESIDVGKLYQCVDSFCIWQRGSKPFTVTEKFMESIEMGLCGEHYREFVHDQSSNIRALGKFLAREENAYIKEYLLENYVCKILERLSPDGWRDLEEYMENDSKGMQPICGEWPDKVISKIEGCEMCRGFSGLTRGKRGMYAAIRSTMEECLVDKSIPYHQILFDKMLPKDSKDPKRPKFITFEVLVNTWLFIKEGYNLNFKNLFDGANSDGGYCDDDDSDNEENESESDNPNNLS